MMEKWNHGWNLQVQEQKTEPLTMTWANQRVNNQNQKKPDLKGLES